jgi:hypothetical protein
VSPQQVNAFNDWLRHLKHGLVLAHGGIALLLMLNLGAVWWAYSKGYFP